MAAAGQAKARLSEVLAGLGGGRAAGDPSPLSLRSPTTASTRPSPYVAVVTGLPFTLRGKAVAVVMARAEFERRSAKAGSFVEFLRRSPLALVGREGQRKKRAARRVRR